MKLFGIAIASVGSCGKYVRMIFPIISHASVCALLVVREIESAFGDQSAGRKQPQLGVRQGFV